MKNADRLELKKRFKKDCTISRIAGCYVDCNKEKVLNFNENFLNLPEEELFKYLEIAKKSLSGTIGNNLLELSFPTEEEKGGKQQYLCGLRESKLQNEELLDVLYSMIIEKYQYTGNYLILVFNDSYDVMTKTTDNIKLDESEEVFEYLLVSICPVDLTKAGLGYRADQNRIGARVRDWVVGAPDLAFIFPAFDERSANIHRVDYYVKDPKAPHAEFIRDVLGCGQKRTALQQRDVLKSVIKQAYGTDQKKAEDVMMEIQESISSMVEAKAQEEGKLAAPIEFSDQVLSELLEDTGVKEEKAQEIKRICREEFADDKPTVDDLLDARAVKANAPIMREKELMKEVVGLKEKLKASHEKLAQVGLDYEDSESASDKFEGITEEKNSEGEQPDKNYNTVPAASASLAMEEIPMDNILFEEDGIETEYMDVMVRVDAGKADMIKTCIINNQKCIMIPIDDSEEMGIVVR